ncbi:hypothetical protein GW17_00029966 [Ensete ventricosum]|nr:hypothetical protein GW17_00029966 [Ensete ventricosum]
MNSTQSLLTQQTLQERRDRRGRTKTSFSHSVYRSRGKSSMVKRIRPRRHKPLLDAVSRIDLLPDCRRRWRRLNAPRRQPAETKPRRDDGGGCDSRNGEPSQRREKP